MPMAKKAPTVVSQPPPAKAPTATVGRKTSTTKPTTAAPKVASQQQDATPAAGNWINRTVQNSVAGVGTYASSLVYGVGDSVNKVGEGIGNT